MQGIANLHLNVNEVIGFFSPLKQCLMGVKVDGGKSRENMITSWKCKRVRKEAMETGEGHKEGNFGSQFCLEHLE